MEPARQPPPSSARPPAPSWEALDQPTAQGAKGIFRRFIIIAVGLNALVGTAVVIFDVADSIWTTHDFLRDTGQLATRITNGLRQERPQPEDWAVRRASQLTGLPMALLDASGGVHHPTVAGIDAALQRVYRGERPGLGTRFAVRGSLGELSGAWVVSRYSETRRLLVIVTRHPEDEGLAEYMTIAAGLTGLGLAVSFVIMLITSNWMLRRPLSRLVSQLTSALAKDVQRRRDAEEAAVAARMEAEEHLAFRDYLIDASEAFGIVATDAEGKIQILNRAAEQILRTPAAEVEGKLRLDELLRRPPLVRDKSFPLLHPDEGEEFVIDREGKEHLLDLKRSDIRDADGKVRGLLVTFVDVTERRRLEAELQLNELKLLQSAKLATLGEMATGIAHELNQPLNNISLLGSRLQRKLHAGSIPAEERAFFEDKLGKVQTQIERAVKIIDHLRTFGRVRTKTMGSVRVKAPVEGMMVFVSEQLHGHGIELYVEIPDDLPAVVADEAQLEQVLMNLVVNARDALDELPEEPGRPKLIRITAARTTLEGEIPGVCIKVIDNGPGMFPEVIERIFDPFFTTKEVGKGTGLGLSISYGLVRDFGGRLEVESEVGRGSTFSVRLRIADTGQAQHPQHPAGGGA